METLETKGEGAERANRAERRVMSRGETRGKIRGEKRAIGLLTIFLRHISLGNHRDNNPNRIDPHALDALLLLTSLAK